MYFRVNLNIKKPILCCCFTWTVLIEFNFTVAFLLIRKTWPFICLQKVACLTSNRSKSRHWDSIKWLFGRWLEVTTGMFFYESMTIILAVTFFTGRRLRGGCCAQSKRWTLLEVHSIRFVMYALYNLVTLLSYFKLFLLSKGFRKTLSLRIFPSSLLIVLTS